MDGKGEGLYSIEDAQLKGKNREKIVAQRSIKKIEQISEAIDKEIAETASLSTYDHALRAVLNKTRPSFIDHSDNHIESIIYNALPSTKTSTTLGVENVLPPIGGARKRKAAHKPDLAKDNSNPLNTHWINKDIPLPRTVEQFDFDQDDNSWITEMDMSMFAKNISEDIKRDQLAKFKAKTSPLEKGISFIKPAWSYSCLIALALKNSPTGQLAVADIYAFLLENFPYFRSAPSGWKNSVRHNLSLNKCFTKIVVHEEDSSGSASQSRKSCLWQITPDRAYKLDDDIRKMKEKSGMEMMDSLARPEDMQAIEDGTKGIPESSLYSTQNTRNGYIDKAPIRLPMDSKLIENKDEKKIKQEEEEEEVFTRCVSPMLSMYYGPLVSTPDNTSTFKSHNEDNCEKEKADPLLELLSTPPRSRREHDMSSISRSPFGFRHVDTSANNMTYSQYHGLNENSLLSAIVEESALMTTSLGYSPKKNMGPVTFPIM